jgi:hypothetical protein
MILDRLIAIFTSLRLTVVCLAFGMVLVLAGTLAQGDLGLYKVQHEFFRSLFVLWRPLGAGLPIPLPGGYLVGGVLLINLVCAHYRRFTFTRDKAGIWLIHFGLILLLLGQLLTDLLSRDSLLHLRQGEAKNYSESNREVELAVIDVTDPAVDKVVAIPQGQLMRRQGIREAALPFSIRVKDYYANAAVARRPADSVEPPAATQGIGQEAIVKGLPRVTATDQRDEPSAIVELVSPQGSLGSWLVSEQFGAAQAVSCGNRVFNLALRLRRFYQPFSLQLLEFRHDVYPGTEIPKNFSSRVLLRRPETGERREVLIYMNNPLRYAGQTFYQADFDPDDQGTVLEVVHNPSWLTPYLSCVLVGAGLVWQFATHLLGFTLFGKRAPASGPAAAPAPALALKHTKA